MLSLCLWKKSRLGNLFNEFQFVSSFALIKNKESCSALIWDHIFMIAVDNTSCDTITLLWYLSLDSRTYTQAHTEWQDDDDGSSLCSWNSFQLHRARKWDFCKQAVNEKSFFFSHPKNANSGNNNKKKMENFFSPSCPAKFPIFFLFFLHHHVGD